MYHLDNFIFNFTKLWESELSEGIDSIVVQQMPANGS